MAIVALGLVAANLDGISGSSPAWYGMKNSEGMNNDDLKRSRESRRLKVNPSKKGTWPPQAGLFLASVRSIFFFFEVDLDKFWILIGSSMVNIFASIKLGNFSWETRKDISWELE